MDGFLIGRVFGVELRVSRSWIIVILLVAVGVSSQFQDDHPQWSATVSYAAGVVTSLLLFASVLAHELAHTAAARRFGIGVRAISLNFFGGLSWLSRPALRPVEEFGYSIAGPLANIAIAGLFLGIGAVATGRAEVVAAVATRTGLLNLLLALFNMLPGFPLDGGRIVRAIVWRITGSYERGTIVASIAGQALAALFMMAGLAVVFSGDVGGLLIGLVGYYLFTRARAGMGEVVLRRALAGLTVGSLWLETLPQIEGATPLADFVRELSPASTGRADPHVMIVDRGVIRGVLPSSRALAVEARRWAGMTVGDLMTPIESIEKLTFETDLVRAMEAIHSSGIGELPVVDDNVVQGFVSRESLLKFIANRVSANTESTP